MKKKFEVGDTVFYLYNHKIKESHVFKIIEELPVISSGSESVNYTYFVSLAGVMQEKLLFKTKQELINSL